MLVKPYVERSMLVPDHVITRLMLPKLEQLSGQSWLLDGEISLIYSLCMYCFVCWRHIVCTCVVVVHFNRYH